jgi:hypothetical protein
MKKLLFFAVASLTVNFACAVASAFSETPTAWRVESYSANNVVIWHTPAACSNGLISLPDTATVTESNRLYATVMYAKATGAKMFIQYSNDTGSCVITSFGVDA